jgi:Sulfotransferase domain
MKKPNLFVIGAMKSGTTSLAQYLSLHPQIFVPNVKEPFHFSREENWEKGNDNYMKLFCDATNEKYLVDASTDYTKRPKYSNVSKRIYEFNPDSKLIYLLRDPFERLVSNYKHEIKRKRVSEKLSEVINNPNDIVFNSHYAYQLKPYIEIFGKEKIYIATFEEMKLNPKKFFKDLFEWLKIDKNFIPENKDEKFNVTPEKIVEINEDSLITNFMRNLKRKKVITFFTPRLLQEWLKKKMIPYNTIAEFNSTKFIEDIEKVRILLNPILINWIKELENLTGKSFSIWTSVEEISNNQLPIDSPLKIWFPKNLS